MERVKIINKTSENSILKHEWLQLLVEFHLYVSNAKNPKIMKYLTLVNNIDHLFLMKRNLYFHGKDDSFGGFMIFIQDIL